MKRFRLIVLLPIILMTLPMAFMNTRAEEKKELPKNVLISTSGKARASEIANIGIKFVNQNGFTIKDLSIQISGVETEDIHPFVRLDTFPLELSIVPSLSDGKNADISYVVEVPKDTPLGTYPLQYTFKYKDLYGDDQSISDTFFVEVIKPNVVIGPFRSVLDFFNDWFGNYFWSILILSILIKVVMYPLNVSSMKSQAQMLQIQPKIAEIKKLYKSDLKKQQEETMKLYKEEKINPASGCLPMIPQLAVLMLLYNALQNYTPLYQNSFLWIESLGRPDPYYIFPILAGAATFLQTLATGQAQEGQNKMLTFLMPLIFFFIMRNFPAALSIFWTFFGVLSWIQQYIYNRARKNTSLVSKQGV